MSQRSTSPSRYNKAHHHLYNTKVWRTTRARHLAEHPLCVYCMTRGQMTPATVCDHIAPHKGNTALFYDASNLQSLCKLCHDSAKAKEEHADTIIGCNTDGTPLDPSHHWKAS